MIYCLVAVCLFVLETESRPGYTREQKVPCNVYFSINNKQPIIKHKYAELICCRVNRGSKCADEWTVTSPPLLCMKYYYSKLLRRVSLVKQRRPKGPRAQHTE